MLSEVRVMHSYWGILNTPASSLERSSTSARHLIVQSKAHCHLQWRQSRYWQKEHLDA